MREKLKVGLIGCGVIGARRLQIVHETGLGTIVGVYDPDQDRATQLCRRFSIRQFEDATSLTDQSDVVLVATPNSFLSKYSEAALEKNKHVLVEKPGAISQTQARYLNKENGKAVCKIGYNHRFHPAALKIRQLLEEQDCGKMLWIRAAYGHGGRPGYEREWRFQPETSGGGEIIDQGVHLLDLIGWWTQDAFSVEKCIRQNAFYRSSVEDNGFLTLRSTQGVFAQLHCSVTQWKNLFRVEICTENCLLHWEGLGNINYGPEVLRVSWRNPAGGAPRVEILEFGHCSEESWEAEWRHFYDCILKGQKVYSSPEELDWVFSCLDAIHSAERVNET